MGSGQGPWMEEAAGGGGRGASLTHEPVTAPATQRGVQEWGHADAPAHQPSPTTTVQGHQPGAHPS